MPISAELKRVYASAPADRRYVETVELFHSLFPVTYWLANDVQGWDFLLEDGTPQHFDLGRFAVVLPVNDGRGQQDLQLTVDNVGRVAMDALEAAALNPQENIRVTYRVYVDLAGTLPQNDPPLVLSLSKVVATPSVISGTASRADTLNRPFPSFLYRPDLYPGLDR
jgi:hypothetical protein